MPRPKKAPRLWLRPKRRTRPENSKSDLSGSSSTATSTSPQDALEPNCSGGRKAPGVLATKYAPVRKARDIENIAVADVLSIYDDDKRDGQQNKKSFDERIERLNELVGIHDAFGDQWRKLS